MDDIRTVVFHDNPKTLFPLATLGLTAIALQSQTLPSAILLLTTLLVYGPIVVSRRNTPWNVFILWLSLTAGRVIPWLMPSIHALDSPVMSIITMATISGMSSILALGPVLAHSRFRSRYPAARMHLLVFPSAWACIWFLVSNTSPVGRLALWSPGHVDAYRWLLPIAGPVGIDWITAAWAVVGSQVVEGWVMGSTKPDETPLLGVTRSGNTHDKTHQGSLVMFYVLAVLSLPSLLTVTTPLPLWPPSEVTQVSVGCVLPPRSVYKHHAPTFEDYIAETKKLKAYATILLWPEGAVTFRDEHERTQKLEMLQKALQGPGTYVGLSYEQTYEDPSNPRSSITRTSMALVSNDMVYLDYHKRHLVPVAESFSLRHSAAPPAVVSLNVTRPLGTTIPEWGGAHREITVTTSICLDFAFPSQFNDLDAKPAIILAPARTWHTTVGEAMWEQAKLRAYELDTMILWCDGGAGGLSGIAGKGVDQVMQAGEGSWYRNIGVAYPFDEGRTLYARGGDTLVLVILLGLSLGSAWAGMHLVSGIESSRRRFGAWSESLRERRNPPPDAAIGNLLDI